jgi:phosphonopyruvate decarboxylase
MISPATFLALLEQNDICFFAGVPDSLLQALCAEIVQSIPTERHIIAANEGSAVALAAGYHLATGRFGCVYLQNSGLGNAVNPLVSLMDPEVYGIPVLLLIGWRGELIDGVQVKDEPQHVKQGRITRDMLQCLGIPHGIVSANTTDLDGEIIPLISQMRAESRPVALVVRKGAFGPTKGNLSEVAYPLTREQALRFIVEILPDDVIVVATTGKTSRELCEIRQLQGRKPEADFLTVGSMGHALQIASGIAVARPERKVMCVDGDGALIMQLGGITTAATICNLSHITINNGAHESVGGQPTRGFHIDMPMLARACGYGTARSVCAAEELRGAIHDAVSSRASAFIEIRIRPGSRPDLGRPKSTPAEAKRYFMRSLGVSR